MSQPTFAAWRIAVDRRINIKAGLSAADLADVAYRDMYEDEMSPDEAADWALEENGFPVELAFE
jgi:hypothetical protein